MTYTHQAARQGDTSENHIVAKIVVVSTAVSFVSLAILALT